MKPREMFFAGVPTEPDVKLIVENMGDIQEGQLIGYGELQAMLGLDRHSNRFRSVITSWKRKMFRERNLVLEAVPGEGYRALPPIDRVGYSSRKVVHGFRRIRQGASVARSTRREGLGSGEKRTLDHLSNIDATLRLAEATAAKAIKMPDPVKA